MSKSIIKVQSYNILYDDPEKWGEEWGWEKRAEGVYQMVFSRKPDLVGFQEVTLKQLKDLESALSGYCAVGKEIYFSFGNSSEFFANPVFFRPSRLKLLDSGWILLTKNERESSASVRGPGSGGGGGHVRSAVWCIFESVKEGVRFFFLNTHFPTDDSMHPRCVRLILRLAGARAEDLPVIIGGDFNTNENLFSNSGFTDAVEMSLNRYSGPSGSKVDRKTKKVVDKSKIDHFFIRGKVKVDSFYTIDDRSNGSYPSDHLPILAVFCIQK